MPLEMVVRQDVINRNRGFSFRSERTPDRTKNPRLKPGLLEAGICRLLSGAAQPDYLRASGCIVRYSHRARDDSSVRRSECDLNRTFRVYSQTHSAGLGSTWGDGLAAHWRPYQGGSKPRPDCW